MPYINQLLHEKHFVNDCSSKKKFLLVPEIFHGVQFRKISREKLWHFFPSVQYCLYRELLYTKHQYEETFTLPE